MIELQGVIDTIAQSGVLSDMGGFDADKTFKANGVDSLDVMNIFLAVEEQYGIKFSDDEVEEINSASDLLRVLNTKTIASR